MIRLICLFLNVAVLLAATVLLAVGVDELTKNDAPAVRASLTFDDLIADANKDYRFVPLENSVSPPNVFDQFDPQRSPTLPNVGNTSGIYLDPVMVIAMGLLMLFSASIAIWFALTYTKDGSLWSLYLQRLAAEQKAKIRALDLEARDL